MEENTLKKKWSGYKQSWGGKVINKTKLKKWLSFNFEKLLEKNYEGWKFKFSDKKLLSVSSILKNINEYNFFRIPKQLLDYRKELGSNFMRNCLQILKQQEQNLDCLNISELEKKHLTTFFNWIVSNEMKILFCEKLITNGCLISFLDFVIRDKNGDYFILEVKLRNSLEVKQTDIFQLRVYCEMVGIPGKLIIIGDSGEVKVENVIRPTFKKELKLATQFYKIFGVELFFDNRLEIGNHARNK